MEKYSSDGDESNGSITFINDEESINTPLLPHMTSSPNKSSSIRKVEAAFVPSLEGLRGVAIIIVLISHLWSPCDQFTWVLGMMGVTTFFALSGYLITGILLKMQSTGTYMHLPLFFASRTVRLAPSLFLCVFGTVVLWMYSGRSFVNIKEHIITVLLYLENIYCRDRKHENQILAQTWTLAVEEQFYIVWAILLPLISSGKLARRSLMLGTIFAVSFIYRTNMFLIGDFAMMSKSLSANSYALIAGSSLRLLPVPLWMHTRNATYIGQLLFVLTVLAIRADLWSIYGCMYGPFIAVIATLMTIIGSVAGGNWILEAPILRHFGRVSYSLYLWHHVFLWLSATFNQITIQSIGVISLSWIVAETSTIYIEEPIREYFKDTAWFKKQKRKIAMASL